MLATFHSFHRYRCTDVSCGWQGVFDRRGVECSAWERATLRFAVLASVAAIALATSYGLERADVAAPLREPNGATSPATVQPPAGETSDGVSLASNDARAVGNASTLTLRRGCAWGVPGRNRYRGTVDQALLAAKLERNVAADIGSRIDRHAITDRVEISREAIRTIDQRRRFATTTTMAFGTSLCFDTRVNFARGHVEYADLYETVAPDGKRVSVMVPDVCGNVSVLAERAEEWPGGGEDGNHTVTEPPTLATATLGLIALAWMLRRRR